jgi:hypothetical protein
MAAMLSRILGGENRNVITAIIGSTLRMFLTTDQPFQADFSKFVRDFIKSEWL